MKVAYLLGSLSRGGTETLLLDLFVNAKKTTFEIMGIHRKNGELRDAFYKTELDFYQLEPKFPFDPIYLYRLRKLLKKNRVYIVHAQQSIDAVYVAIALIGTGIKVVQTFHGYDMKCGAYPLFIMKLSMRCVARNLFVSYTQKSYYQKKYSLKENQCGVVYNGVSFDKLDNFEKKSIREELNIDKNTLLLGSVGNFLDVRDQYTICLFLKLLKEKDICFKFLFVGKASDSAKYQKCVDFCCQNGLETEVLFLGSRIDVPNILNQIDAFVYASDHDTFGIAVIEAIASSLPTFVNDWDAMREITEDGRFATLYKTKDVNDLLNKMDDFICHIGAYKENAKVASLEIRKKYSIESHINQLFAVYNLIK
ncbi:MAG: glycosyltransferase family 4 protein [Paludibacteraceae bacterium]|nr:glycosyltransferase family 4 protein [Paludibacteraceae bacterium]HOU69455.1 glycosyltransferase family 4 protein [Paludibacteraceae bacterium]